MNTFSIALLLIGIGGLQALFTCRWFLPMKLLSVTTIIGGCGLGLYDAVLRIFQHVDPFICRYEWMQVFSFSLTIDPVSAFFLVPIFAISAVAALYSLQYLRDRGRAAAIGSNYFFYALLIISMVLVVSAANLITFALAWELMSLSSFFLVIYDFHKKSTRDAGGIYFIFTQAGALFIFAAFGILYAHTGSFGFDGISAIPDPVKLSTFLLILIGCGSKAGIMPLHIWLPHAHPAAPSHISAVMSGVMIKIGIYGIVRFYLLLEPASPLFGQIIIVLGMISGILGVVYALGKHDIKRLLAYHSVENIGIILLGLGIGMLGVASDNTVMAAFGFAGGLLHVLNHSLFKSLLFLGAGAVIQQTGTGTIDSLGGLMKKMSITSGSFLVGSLSISGLPPFNGFISEFLIYYGAFHGLTLKGTSFVLATLAIVSLAVIGGLAAACFTKVTGIVFLGSPRTDCAENATEPGVLMSASQLLLAISCLVIGLWPEPFVRTAFQASRVIPLLADFNTLEFLPLIQTVARTAALFLVLFFLVTIIRKLLYMGKEVSHSGTWGCGFSYPTARMQYTGTSYADSMISFFRPFLRIQKTYSGIDTVFPQKSHYSSHIQDSMETALATLIIRPTLFLLSKLRWIQHGNIQLYIGYIVLTIVIMLVFLQVCR